MTAELTVSTNYVFRGRAVNLRVDTVELASGKQTTREIVEHEDCIAAVPIDADNRVLLVRQFRKAVDKELLEIPAGGIEPKETPADATRRELQEEIGYLPQKIEEIGGFYSAPGYATEYLHLFLATELKPARLVAEDTESIKVERYPFAEIPRLIASGEIRDAKSIAGLLTAIPKYLGQASPQSW